MNSSGEIAAIQTKFKLLELWNQDSPFLWTSPSSPPYHAPSAGSSPARNPRADQPASSPSTPSEFEFDSLAAADIRDECPVSPKFLSSFAAGGQHTAQISSSRADFMSPMCRSDGAVSTVGDTPPSDLSKKGSSTPVSFSVGRFITEEAFSAELDSSQSADPGLCSALRTPAASGRPPSRQEKQQMGTHVAPSSEGRKSISAVEDGPDMAPYPGLANSAGLRGLTQSKSSIASSSSSSSSWSAMHAWDMKAEDEKKKAGASRSLRRWAFKDLLRRTVPSSKADANFIAKTFESPIPSKSSASDNPRSRPPSPQASSYPLNSATRAFSLPLVRPPSRTPPRSPTHPPSSTSNSTQTTIAHVEGRLPQPSWPPSQTPTPSPPQSPISKHIAHYRLQKAQSQELSKKTFLPYRQSLLGCLGGFSSNQLVC